MLKDKIETILEFADALEQSFSNEKYTSTAIQQGFHDFGMALATWNPKCTEESSYEEKRAFIVQSRLQTTTHLRISLKDKDYAPQESIAVLTSILDGIIAHDHLRKK